MDKILSARVDESVIKKIGTLALTLRMTKKAVIEAAVRAYSEKKSKGRRSIPWSRPSVHGSGMKLPMRRSGGASRHSVQRWEDTSVEGLHRLRCSHLAPPR